MNKILTMAALLALIAVYVNSEASPTTPPGPSKFDKRIVQLDREAIDNAYREKIEQLFDGWLKDKTAQPLRAMNGANEARAAYIRAMDAIEKRAAELEVKP